MAHSTADDRDGIILPPLLVFGRLESGEDTVVVMHKPSSFLIVVREILAMNSFPSTLYL